MEVSWNRATPTSSILMVFCIINHPFGGTPISWAFLWGIYWTVFWSPQTPHVTQDATDLRHVIGAAEALSTITRDTHRQLANMPWHGKKMLGNIQDLLHCLLCWVWYIYISCTYINTYMYTSYFQTRPKCDVVWFDLIWMVLDAAWQWRLCNGLIKRGIGICGFWQWNPTSKARASQGAAWECGAYTAWVDDGRLTYSNCLSYLEVLVCRVWSWKYCEVSRFASGLESPPCF